MGCFSKTGAEAKSRSYSQPRGPDRRTEAQEGSDINAQQPVRPVAKRQHVQISAPPFRISIPLSRHDGAASVSMKAFTTGYVREHMPYREDPFTCLPR
ncbi:hypothetical protein CCHR01_15609 [Colletotrichum chrysophilum]|uniref:Uncharacterized protein n=1 Tax=Colletotrichum chrysophilum TaxID=1836956 RepID=A0AAD9A631_9PEZI|nr:hypothetical protein CCHR01_15609 [Colletotrichum chrysophilum]